MRNRLRFGNMTLAVASAVSLAVAVAACSGTGVEERARVAAEKVRESLDDADAAALNQTVDANVLREVQTQLARLNEYQGEIDGKLDAVTINAIQAFQRTAGLEDDGVLDARTRQRLKAAAG